MRFYNWRKNKPNKLKKAYRAFYFLDTTKIIHFYCDQNLVDSLLIKKKPQGIN